MKRQGYEEREVGNEGREELAELRINLNEAKIHRPVALVAFISK